MAQEIENNNKKKLFSRWKENLRDFFIEDEKLNEKNTQDLSIDKP